MDFFSNIIEVIKDFKHMFILSILILISCLIQKYLGVDFLFASGISLFAISSIGLTVQWIRNRNKKGQNEILDKKNALRKSREKYGLICNQCNEILERTKSEPIIHNQSFIETGLSKFADSKKEDWTCTSCGNVQSYGYNPNSDSYTRLT